MLAAGQTRPAAISRRAATGRPRMPSTVGRPGGQCPDPGARCGARRFCALCRCRPAGTAMYTNALGLGGAAGNQAATNAFQTGPGYEWQIGRACRRSTAALPRAACWARAIPRSPPDLRPGPRQPGIRQLARPAGGTAGDGRQYRRPDRGDQHQHRGQPRQPLFDHRQPGCRGFIPAPGENLADIAQNTAQNTAGVRTALGDARYDYGSDVAGLGYATRLGQGAAQAGYLAGTDALGNNLMQFCLRECLDRGTIIGADEEEVNMPARSDTHETAAAVLWGDNRWSTFLTFRPPISARRIIPPRSTMPPRASATRSIRTGATGSATSSSRGAAALKEQACSTMPRRWQASRQKKALTANMPAPRDAQELECHQCR